MRMENMIYGFRNLEDKEFTGDYYIIKSTIINPFQTNDKYSFWQILLICYTGYVIISIF